MKITWKYLNYAWLRANQIKGNYRKAQMTVIMYLFINAIFILFCLTLFIDGIVNVSSYFIWSSWYIFEVICVKFMLKWYILAKHWKKKVVKSQKGTNVSNQDKTK